MLELQDVWERNYSVRVKELDYRGLVVFYFEIITYPREVEIRKAARINNNIQYWEIVIVIVLVVAITSPWMYNDYISVRKSETDWKFYITVVGIVKTANTILPRIIFRVLEKTNTYDTFF